MPWQPIYNSNEVLGWCLLFQRSFLPNINSIPLKTKEILTYRCGCHGNLVARTKQRIFLANLNSMQVNTNEVLGLLSSCDGNLLDDNDPLLASIIIEKMSFYFRKHSKMANKRVPRNDLSDAHSWTTVHVLQKQLSICTHTVGITISLAWADRAELEYSGKTQTQRWPALFRNLQSFIDCSV